MGRGYVKQKNAMKKQYMEPLRKYCEQLEKENAALKGDPNTVIGQFIGQYREVYSQNSRLSVLCATLIKKLGEKVVVAKEEMESFQQKRINIKWEVPEGFTVETATEYTFSYELQDAPQAQSQVQAPEPVECTDPNCTLPKDLKHSHTAQPVAPTEDPTVVVTEYAPEPPKPGDAMRVNGEEVTVTSVETTS